MPINIFLVRHAEPLRDPNIEYRRMPGPNLSPHGRQEARMAAAFLAPKGVQHLYISPFARTSQTAELLLGTLNVAVTFTRLIAEDDPAESHAQVQQRIHTFLTELRTSAHTCVAVVSHGTPIREMLLHLTQDTVDLSVYTDVHQNPAPTAGIWHVQQCEPLWRAALVFEPTQDSPLLAERTYPPTPPGML